MKLLCLALTSALALIAGTTVAIADDAALSDAPTAAVWLDDDAWWLDELTPLAAPTAEAAAADPLAAPALRVTGQTLAWDAVPGVSSYWLVRKVPGQRDEYSPVRATSVTPTPVPGQTVRFSVRTNVTGSAWARELTISYPLTSPPPQPQPQPQPPAVPTLTLSGQTLTWSAVAGVASYLVARRMTSGQLIQQQIVSGTSITPVAVAGQTFRYSVRTNVTGSAWSNEVSISYPAAPAPAPRPPPPPPPAPAPSPPPAPAPSPAPAGPFSLGIVAGAALSYEQPFVASLGARTARLEFEIYAPASQLRATIDRYARAGIRPLLLAGFHGRLPSAAEAQNVAGWAAEFGPGGSFWQGKSYPANTAVTAIEFGNETSYAYQFSDTRSAASWWNLTSYVDRARTYALRFRDAQSAVRAANPNVGLLAIGESGDGNPAWLRYLFDAVPDLGERAAGWTVHPYGPRWQSRMDAVLANARAEGAPDTTPLWVTEWGLATDNGRCLDDNYGWDECMTYDEAAATARSVIPAMRSRYGRRLAALYVYQAHDQQNSGASSGREHYFGGVQANGAAKGAYTSELRAQLAASP